MNPENAWNRIFRQHFSQTLFRDPIHKSKLHWLESNQFGNFDKSLCGKRSIPEKIMIGLEDGNLLRADRLSEFF